MPRFPFLPAVAGLLLLAACDNVGRAFDPDVTPPDQGGTTVASTIEAPPNGGDVRDGRPIVRATYPSGGGWPSTVPIVIEFSESMNQSSILPTTNNGTDGKIVLRPANTTTAVPVVYNFLAGGRVLVLRPLANLDAPQQASYDIVMLPGVRDADGLRFSATTETTLATFTIDPNATADATVMAVYPRDNQTDIASDAEFLCFFTRAVDPTSLPNNFVLRTQGSTTPLPGLPGLPLTVANVPEARCVGYTLQGGATLPASTTIELVVNASIRFANNGVLQFNNRTPYSRFSTSGVPNPTSIAVDNIANGFPHKVNRGNLATLSMAVQVPATAAVGDLVVARVYGGDKSTSGAGDLAFVQRTSTLTVAGQQTALVNFSGELGSVTRTKFDEGALTYTAQLYRGSAHSGVVRGNAAAAQDTVQPALVSLGPPVGANDTDLYAELETLTVFGTASEPLGDAVFTLGLPTPLTGGLFASRTGGTFLLAPVVLGRRTNPVSYSLLITDLAGNTAVAPATGNVIQRGLLTGSLLSGELTVEAFDSATLRAVSGAEVIVDIGVPTIPPTGATRLTGTTDESGRVTFSSLTSASHTITINKTGYDLVTLYNSPVAFASLPLRPTDGELATTILSATATLPNGAAGATVIAGCNLFDDAGTATIRSTTATPTGLPLTTIVPFRPIALTGFGGVFEPTGAPAFTSAYCNLLGANLQSPSPPAAPATTAANFTATIALRDVGSSIGAVVPHGGIDFAASAGFLSGSLAAAPRLRIMAAIDGFVGQVPVGVGFPTGANPSLVTANGAFSTAILTGLATFAPVAYVLTEATDSASGFSRTRALLNPTTGVGSPQALPQDLPNSDPLSPTTVAAPPQLEIYDAIDTSFVETTLPGVLLSGLVGLYEFRIDQMSGTTRVRSWRVFAEDRNGGSSPIQTLRQYQLPAAATNPTLANGTWEVLPSASVFRPGTGSVGDYVLGEVRHGEVTFTRAARFSLTVQ